MSNFFICIGAQKSATSWLYNCAYEHPEIDAPIKEINFFSRDKIYNRGTAWYESRFRYKDTSIAGEFSTSYLSSAVAALRIYNFNSKTKIVCIVRDPVDRAYSSYINEIRAGRVNSRCGFLDAIKLNPEIYEKGLYAKHLNEYLKYFESILLLDYNEICSNPASVLKKFFIYLGVDNSFKPSSTNKIINRTLLPRSRKLEAIIASVARLLSNFGLSKIRWYVRNTGLTDFLRNVNGNSAVKQSESEREAVYKMYIEDQRLLDKLKCDKRVCF